MHIEAVHLASPVLPELSQQHRYSIVGCFTWSFTVETWALGRRGFVSLQRNATTWAEHQCTAQWCCVKKPVPPSMAGYLLETVSSNIALSVGGNEKCRLSFSSSLCCFRNCLYHPLLFSLVTAAPLSRDTTVPLWEDWLRWEQGGEVFGKSLNAIWEYLLCWWQHSWTLKGLALPERMSLAQIFC